MARTGSAERPNARRPISAILLAAGLSRRFGRPKQLAELEGAALVRRALETLERAPVDEIVVVVGHRAPEVSREVRGTRARVVHNESFAEGLGSSLREGVAAIDSRSVAAIVCLADQPFVTRSLISRIVSRYRRTGVDVVASTAGGLVSPPVLFSRRLFGELSGVKGDRGAKAVIESHPGFETVEAGAHALLDVDTEADLERAGRILRLGGVRRSGRGRGAGRPSPGLPSSATRSARRPRHTRRSE
jgi:molybdenum cofactor cytidylyltransferase